MLKYFHKTLHHRYLIGFWIRFCSLHQPTVFTVGLKSFWLAYCFFAHFIAKQNILGKCLKSFYFTFTEKRRNVPREKILKLIRNVKDSYETRNHGRFDYPREPRTLSELPCYVMQNLIKQEKQYPWKWLFVRCSNVSCDSPENTFSAFEIYFH